MAESKYTGEAGEDGDDTDELLCADEVSHSGSTCLALPRDHCDLLLDAIDAELSRLQSQHYTDDSSKGASIKGFAKAYLGRSSSLSKDTGLGSNSPSNDKEYQDFEPAHPIRPHSDNPSSNGGGTQCLAEGPQERGGNGAKPCPVEVLHYGLDSRTEQCRWRLERLLGTAGRGPVIDTTTPPVSDCTVCTEDLTEHLKAKTVDLERNSKAASCLSFAYDAGTLTDHTDATATSEPASKNRTMTPFKENIRYLAGVPVRNFDAVTIDSDLDSVRTEQVHRHLHKSFSPDKVIKAVEQMDSMCSEKSDWDTLAEQHGTTGSRATIDSSGQPSPTHCRGKLFSSDDNSEDSESVSVPHSRSLHRAMRHLSGHHRRPRASRVRERMTERRLLEETLSKLRKDSEREESKLMMTRAKLSETEQSITDLLQQRQSVLQELDELKLEVTQRGRDCQRIQADLRDSSTQADTSRSELRRLQGQRDSCVMEVSALQGELEALCIRTYDSADANRQPVSGVSVLERDEMDRQLDRAKSELFTEQRRFRHALDSMTERLDDAQQELEQREEELRVVRRRCTELEEQLTHTTTQKGAQDECLHRQLKGQEVRVEALERIVAQKEVLLLGLQEERSTLQLELSSQKEEIQRQCTSMQQEAQREKEEALEEQRVWLSQDHVKSLEQACILSQDEKCAALKEQAQSHTQHVETLERRIQLKEEDVRRLGVVVEKQEEATRSREEQLRGETQHKVQEAVTHERRRCEEQREAALQEQQERLRREAQQEVERERKEAEQEMQKEREEVERERRSALGLQSRVLELQTTVQALEERLSAQQRDHEAAQAATARTLREEHQAHIQETRRQAEEGAERESLKIRQRLQQSEAQLQACQTELAEQQRAHQMALERSEQQQQRWAQQLQMECHSLHGTLGNEVHNTALIGNTLLSHNLGQAVEMVQTLRQQIQKCISKLQQELVLQKHNGQKLEQDKEHELHVQREQLLLEKERGLQTLRETLIQEHIEELSSLKRCSVRGAPEGGGVEALRRRLWEKDEELREVQWGMAQWKERTAERIARKIEEQMSAELERRNPRVRSDPQKKIQRLEEEMRQLTMCGDLNPPGPAPSSSSSKSPHLPASAKCHSQDLASHPPSSPALRSQDLASYKLLRHLQTRIRQLHSESRAQQHSAPPPPTQPPLPSSRPAALLGSYLETIAADTGRP